MKKRSEKKLGQVLKDKADVRAQIAARVARAPQNPNVQKKKYLPDSFGAKRAAAGITLTAIRKSINEPNALVTVMLNEDGTPTGETSTVILKPDAATRKKRRDSFVARGLLGPMASSTERRKVRRRNNRYAAVNSKGSKKVRKSWHLNAAKDARATTAKTKKGS